MATAPVISMYDVDDERRTLALEGVEMRNLSTIHPQDDDLGDETADDAGGSSLEPVNDTALSVRPDATDHRTELYARLRTIIDSAAESIRALKEENAALATQKAAMTEQIGALEDHVRTVTADLAADELALRTSAEGLEQALRGLPAAPTPPAAPEQHADLTAAPAMDMPAPQPAMAETETEPETESESEPATEAATETDTETVMETEAGMEMESEPEAAMPVMEQSVASSMEETGPMPQTEMTDSGSSDAYAYEHERVIAPPPASNPDSTYTLVAYPFVRFSDLGQFQAALQKLTGVHDVQVRRFAQGTLEMRLGYGGPTDLATTLRTLATEIEDVQEEEPYKLRVRLRTSQDS